MHSSIRFNRKRLESRQLVGLLTKLFSCLKLGLWLATARPDGLQKYNKQDFRIASALSENKQRSTQHNHPKAPVRLCDRLRQHTTTTEKTATTTTSTTTTTTTPPPHHHHHTTTAPPPHHPTTPPHHHTTTPPHHHTTTRPHHHATTPPHHHTTTSPHHHHGPTAKTAESRQPTAHGQPHPDNQKTKNKKPFPSAHTHKTIVPGPEPLTPQP